MRCGCWVWRAGLLPTGRDVAEFEDDLFAWIESFAKVYAFRGWGHPANKPIQSWQAARSHRFMAQRRGHCGAGHLAGADAFLECGILAHGFLRLRCGECGHDKLLTFSGRNYPFAAVPGS
jgi:hypothetical protein